MLAEEGAGRGTGDAGEGCDGGERRGLLVYFLEGGGGACALSSSERKDCSSRSATSSRDSGFEGSDGETFCCTGAGNGFSDGDCVCAGGVCVLEGELEKGQTMLVSYTKDQGRSLYDRTCS